MSDQHIDEPSLAEFGKAPYVSLVTFRKTGAPVATPVWCAVQGDACYFFSAGAAGKVKRLRNSDRAQIAVCDVRGRLLGPFAEARAELLSDPRDVATALAALRRKYGWQMHLADLGARLTGRFDKRIYIRARLKQE
jgi:hypothetical protein